MELEALYLRKEQYGENKGKMTGSIEFASNGGKITLVLTSDNSREILRICADRLVEQSREVALQLTAHIIENAGGLIEDKTAAAL